jgi:hypothetical protein
MKADTAMMRIDITIETTQGEGIMTAMNMKADKIITTETITTKTGAIDTTAGEMMDTMYKGVNGIEDIIISVVLHLLSICIVVTFATDISIILSFILGDIGRF